MAEQNTAPLYDGTGRLQARDEDGNGLKIILSENDVLSEMLERLKSREASFAYDANYGSQFYKIPNSRTVSNGQINSWAKSALQPMVDNGKILQNIIVDSVKINSATYIQITATASNNEEIVAKFKSTLF